MPVRNRHKTLTAEKISQALRRHLPANITLATGRLKMENEKIYQTTFGAPHVAGCKYISANMDGIRRERLDEWAETVAHQMCFVLNSDRNLREVGDAQIFGTDRGSRSSVLPDAPPDVPEYGRCSYFGRMLERLVYRRTSEGANR